MTLMICADVLLRNVRIVPGVLGVAWANEVSEAMLYLITMLTAPWLLRQGQHIRVDIVLRAVPPRLGWYSNGSADLLGLACCLLIAWYGARAALASFHGGLAVDQDAGHAGVVAARAAAGRFPAARDRDAVPHAPPVCSASARRATTRSSTG